MTRASTGVPGLDAIIDDLRVGDNVVWQVDSEADFAAVAEPFVGRALAEGRRVLYLSFGQRPPLLDDLAGVEVHTLDPFAGFEPFAIAVHDLLAEVGRLGFYVIDPLSDLHRARFGEVIPLIRREHVAGFYARRPVWLVENLSLDTIRAEARAMEQQAQRFYEQAAQRTTDAATRKLLGDLAAAEAGHDRTAAALEAEHLPEDAREQEDAGARRNQSGPRFLGEG